MRVDVLPMETTVKGSGLAYDEGAEERQVTVVVSELAFEAIVGENADASVSVKIDSALRCYLGDRGTDRPAWPYPGFLRGSETQGDQQVTFEVDESLWHDFSAEADKQDVTVEQLVEHAAFYFAAELDAGRVTQRILDDFGSTESGGGDS
jgi:hypothetical protein